MLACFCHRRILYPNLLDIDFQSLSAAVMVAHTSFIVCPRSFFGKMIWPQAGFSKCHVADAFGIRDAGTLRRSWFITFGIWMLGHAATLNKSSLTGKEEVLFSQKS